MKIQLLSDVHTEFHHRFKESGGWSGSVKRDWGKKFIGMLDTKDVDVLVLAGDITLGYEIPNVLARFAEKYCDAHVIYVHGNHEYYGASNTFQRVFAESMDVAAKYDNLTWLNDGVVTIQGQRFVGTCMWYPDTTEAVLRRKRWSDFSAIPAAGKRIFPANKASVKFLNETVREGDVVVTHMMPTHQSTLKNYRGDPWNCFFVCDMERLIVSKKPKVWMHGHTHDSYDYMLADTRIVCNPYGYQKVAGAPSHNDEFEFKKIVEV